MDADTGYGTAVAHALQHPRPGRPGPAVRAGPGGGVDLAAARRLRAGPGRPGAAAAGGQPRPAAAVLGPKLKDAADRRVLREAGITTDRAGRRLTGIEPGEIDQGQHDGNRPVLAVSSAGMLIRRDVWDQLGGFDPSLPLMRDDIDFCWRAHAAGYDVRVVTDAVVYHRELSARHIRKATAAGGHPRLLDRRGALYVFAANLPFGPMLAIVASCVAGSLLRAAYFLLTKQPRTACGPPRRRRLAAAAPGPARCTRAAAAPRAARHAWLLLRGQLPRGRTLGRLAESAAGLLSGGPGV